MGGPLRHGAVGPGRRARRAARQRARRQRSERAAARADGARPVADGAAPGAHRDRRAGRACRGSAASPPRRYATLELAAGDRLSLPHTGQGARSYLAIAGGIESERFMDSASTDVRGLIGRPLAAGDVLGTAREVVSEMRMSARVDWPVDGATVRILPGPQATREALERLDGAELRTAAGDRTGVRLEGAEIPGGESVSEPPPLGADADHAQRRAVRAARRPLPHGRLREAGGRAPGRPADHRPAAARHARDASSSSSPRCAGISGSVALPSGGARRVRSVPGHAVRPPVRCCWRSRSSRCSFRSSVATGGIATSCTSSPPGGTSRSATSTSRR